MAVCGCGASLAGSPPIVDGGVGDDQGIIVSGTFDNTIITAVAATAWRPLSPDDYTLFNFSLGNGEVNARYLSDGYNIDIIMSFQFGSTSSFSASTWSVDIPFVPQSYSSIINNHGILGDWSVFDASGGLPWYQGRVVRASSGVLQFRYGDDAGGSNSLVQDGTPITFANNDEFSFQVRFEADSN